jgi:hypothetical protein
VAVFFTTLGIEYRYEPEGYMLEGTPYLPDFFLPEYDCFVEIKGQEPTDEEYEKARLLAIYTSKEVYIFAGDVWIPGEKGSYKGFPFRPPRLYAYPDSEHLGGPSTREVKVLPDVLAILEKLDDADIEFHVSKHSHNQDAYITLALDKFFLGLGELQDISSVLDTLQDQLRVLTELKPLLARYERELFETFDVSEEGWGVEFLGMKGSVGWEDYCWYECINCGALSIDIGNPTRHSCNENRLIPTSRNNTSRLKMAYTAARQARFGKGGRG